MITEKNKATRILKEVTGYFLGEHLYDLSIEFKLTQEHVEIRVSAPCDQLPSSFEQFLKDLNVPREIEADEYYNALLGSHTSHADYSFLGKAIDVATGTYHDQVLSLYILRSFVR